MDILRQIAENRRTEIEEIKSRYPIDSLRRSEELARISFAEAISSPGRVNIIAEIKKASPSKGELSADFDPGKIAGQYLEGGAAALSVLTESKHFQGRYDHIKLAKSSAELPVLCKDFVIDPYQIYHANAIGADAILLIVALHNEEEVRTLHHLAGMIGLDVLVEVHNENELEIAINCGAGIIGVNNRDLTSFEVSLDISLRLAEMIPTGITRVAESGIFNRNDIELLMDAGYDAFLIGEALMKSGNPTSTLRELREA